MRCSELSVIKINAFPVVNVKKYVQWMLMLRIIHESVKMEQNVFYALSARKVVLKVHYKIEIYAIGIYPICVYEQQGNSTFVSVRHTHFKAKIGVPPFPFTVGVE